MRAPIKKPFPPARAGCQAGLDAGRRIRHCQCRQRRFEFGASIQAFTYATVDNLTYILTVSNAGPGIASGLVISNQIPASVGFVSGTGFFSLSNSFLLVNFDLLAVGATGSAQVVVQPSAAGEFTK
jgi:uncharacterized repeat protein (TIGR01451 family)